MASILPKDNEYGVIIEGNTLTAIGKSAHGSSPHLGDNALWKIVKFLTPFSQFITGKSPSGVNAIVGISSHSQYLFMHSQPDSSSQPKIIRILLFGTKPLSTSSFVAKRVARIGPLSSSTPLPHKYSPI